MTSGAAAAAHGTDEHVVPAPGAAASACGRDGLPECPLQQWMGAALAQPLRTGAFERLAPALESLRRAGPAEFSDWSVFAARGAAAARQHDGAAVRVACGQCHERYRAMYRLRFREQPLAGALAWSAE